MAPRTVRGLLTDLEKLDPANVLEVVADLDKIANRLDPLNKPPFPDPKPKVVAALTPKEIAALDLRRGTAARAREMAEMCRLLPGLLAALRSLTAETAAPVTTDPLAIPAVPSNDEQWWPTWVTPGEISWWPTLPAAAVEFGDLPTDEWGVHLRYRGGGEAYDRITPGVGLTYDVTHYAATMAALRGRADAWHEFARNMRGGGHHAARRQQARSNARNYLDCWRLLDPIGDRLAADYATYLDNTWAALTVLSETQGETMPALTSSAAVASLASKIRDAVTQGQNGRLQVNDSEVAFSWAPGQAPTLLTYLNTSRVSGRRTTVVTASNSATKAGPVAEGGTKNSAVTFTSEDVDLQKYAGLAEMSTESANYVNNIEQAISSVLVSQIARAIEKDAVTAITAGAGVTITAAADITAGVLSAIAGIRENGGSPTVVGLSSTDWLAIMGQTGGSGYLNFDAQAGPGGTWLGLVPVILPGQTAGSAIVVDGAAVSVLEPAGGPLVLVDVVSQLATNGIRLAVETWAVSTVTSPGGAATVAVGP